MSMGPSFSPSQIETMHCALKRAVARMSEPTPVVEIIAFRILELANAGEFDADTLTETVVAEFDM
jgi:hypothetical protein